MSSSSSRSIAVLDFGGQYAHLIAARLRQLKCYSEVVSPATLTAEEARSKFVGLIYSGGPSSVYGSGAPTAAPELLECGLPILGICYGHQLIMQQLGAVVERSSTHEYGAASLQLKKAAGIFAGENRNEAVQVWMSHGDEVTALPDGFEIVASTPDCEYAAVGDESRNIYTIQFHPEVTDTLRGDVYLTNFIKLCGAADSWLLDDYLEQEISTIRKQVGDKKVFFLISGGVDSTVAYGLLSRALPREHLKGLLVDTGFMRAGEIAEVKSALLKLGVDLEVYDAAAEYFEKLAKSADPEEKRNIIGELFVDIQARVSEQLNLNPDEWYLGQGTIYPDRIESGATKNSDRIKTHHNRVERIEKMLAEGRVVEPIGELYKDEVRRLGRLLGLPSEIVERHPFPGPGLAVRLLCLDEKNSAEALNVAPLEAALSEEKGELSRRLSDAELEAVVLPLRSVGVQGDKRSYAHPLLLLPKKEKWPERSELLELARLAPNRIKGINRVLLHCGGRLELRSGANRLTPRIGALPTPERTELLRKADAVVREFQHTKDIYSEIWQFPVVLAPLGFSGEQSGESIILRPICSTEAMTATAYPMRDEHLRELTGRLLNISGVDAIFFDLTSKPPGTIEWE